MEVKEISLVVLEGIEIGINPNYKVLGDGVFRIDRLQSLLTESLRAKTEKALVEKSMEDENSRMVFRQILRFTLNEKGTFAREVMLQEFAKGLEALGLETLDSFISVATANVPFVSTIRGSSLTDEDVINLRTLQRLVLLLSSVQSDGGNSSTEIEDATGYNNQRRQPIEVSIMLNQISSIREMLPLLSVLLELPPDSQQVVFRLPAELAGKLMSRIAARTLRRALF